MSGHRKIKINQNNRKGIVAVPFLMLVCLGS